MEQKIAAPQIQPPGDLELAPIEREILKKLFSSYAKLRLTREFSEGQSGTRVFLVEPYRTEQAAHNDQPDELPAVAKIGPADLIRTEWRASTTHLLHRLPGFLSIEGDPVFLRDETLHPEEYGALRYEQAGSGIFPVESLRAYTHSAPPVALWRVLEAHLFVQLGRLWASSMRKETLRLSACYDRILPVNLLVSLTAQTRQAPAGAIPLDASALQHEETYPQIEPGDVVWLARFVVIEVDRAERTVTLNLPQPDDGPGPSFRLRLTGIADFTLFQIGKIAPSVTGQVTATRQRLLMESIPEALGPRVDLATKMLALPGVDHLPLPNPLWSWQPLLHRTVPLKIATIHGDLNMGNVLVYADDAGTVHIIDSAQARRDYVLHDLLRLEMETLLHPLAAALYRNGLPPETIHQLYLYLHCACRGEPHPAGQFAIPRGLPSVLWTPFITLTMIRNMARAYLIAPHDWTEYYAGLILYLIGTLKFKSLDRAPVGHQPKVITFWGAATIQWLLDGNGQCEGIQWERLDLTAEAHKQEAQTEATPVQQIDNRNIGVAFEGNQSVNIGGDVVSGGTLNKTTFQGPVMGSVHTGSGDMYVGGPVPPSATPVNGPVHTGSGHIFAGINFAKPLWWLTGVAIVFTIVFVVAVACGPWRAGPNTQGTPQSVTNAPVISGSLIGPAQMGIGDQVISGSVTIGDITTSAAKRAEDAHAQVTDELLENFRHLAVMIQALSWQEPTPFFDVRKTNETELQYQERAKNEFRTYQDGVATTLATLQFSTARHESFRRDLSYFADVATQAQNVYEQQNVTRDAFQRFESNLQHLATLSLTDLERAAQSQSLHAEMLANARIALFHAASYFCGVTGDEADREVLWEMLPFADHAIKRQPDVTCHQQANQLAAHYAGQKAAILAARSTKSVTSTTLDVNEQDPAKLLELAAFSYLELDGGASRFYFERAIATGQLSELERQFAELSIDRIDHPELYQDSIGVFVAILGENGAFAQAGIQVGDVIVAINGETVIEPLDVATALAQAPGTPVLLTMIRNGQPTIVQVQGGASAGALLSQLIIMQGVQL